MNNEELIKGLRWCADESICCDDFSGEKCPYFDEKKDSCSVDEILLAAADALEAADKTVIPHRNYECCHIYWCDCGWFLRNKDQTPNYCPNCGKRIEWENAE